MSIPETYKAFRRSAGDLPLTVDAVTEKLPASLKPQEVLIRIRAVSLNYRDVAMLNGNYPVPFNAQGIVASDCAAEVVKIGSEVQGFSIGDRVAPIFSLNYLTAQDERMSALGGDVDGVLREYAVFDDKVLVHLPKYLSWEEAACITCAGTTAWTALAMPRTNGTALLQGTGGVSMFALLICLAAGLKPIITSSSEEKLAFARSLGEPGAVETINYRDHPEWEKEALRLTDGRGVDVVIENVGPSTMAQSIASIARQGTVSLVGFLGGFNVDKFPDMITPILTKTAVVRGISVGTKIDQQDLCNFLEEKKISLQPLVDKKVFAFDDAPAAFDYLYAGKHVGKVVIRL
ncbi:alcohol dehydrogenase [Aspergillus californicus]